MKNSVITLMMLIALGVLSSGVAAQTSKGTVTGIVTDQNGASVAGAEIELKDAATNQVRTTTTNDSGLYRFDAVELAVYDLVVRAKGFKTINHVGIQVQANRIATLDVKLEVGTTEETVNVNATSGELLQTSDPVRGGNFNSLQIQSLPLAGAGNGYDLGSLLPGVTTATAGAQFGNDSQFSVNGQRPRGNNYLIDGTENNDISVTGPASQINNPDAIAEVSVQTGLFSAEFGRAGGGVFNLVTKSGNNEFHGTGRWTFLSQAFNAITNSNRLSNPTATKPPVFTRNIWGGTFGGPLPLPRFGEGGPAVISGHDRTFFFFGIQWDHNRSTANFPINSSVRVPTVLGVQQLRALFPVGANPRVDLYLTALGETRGVSSLSTIDLGSGRGTIQTGLTGIPFPRKTDDAQWVLRIDHKLNNEHQLAFRYNNDDSIQTPSAIIVSKGFRREFTGKDKNFLVTDTWIASPTFTNELRFSYGKIDFNFPISSDADPLAFTMPQIGISGLATIGTATNIPQFRIANNYLFQYTGTKIHNTHTFRFGAEFLKQVAQQHPPFNERGSFAFNAGGGFTALANFIDNFSGASGTANINFGDPIYHPNLFRHSYFFQDTWKTTKNLTLTLGLRYENFGQPANSAFKFPAFAGFDPAAFTVPNKVNPDNNNFGPVVGFAYTPNAKSGVFGWIFGEDRSVIRGGYQVSYDTFFNNLLSNIAADSPNTLSATTTGPSGRGTANFFPGAIPSTAPAVTPLLSQTSVFNPNIRNPYTQRWSLGIQRELPWRFIMDVSYVGSAGRKLFVSEDLNPINPATGLRLFPALGVRRWRSSGANSDYHSAQFRLDKRMSRGLQLSASYTWSKLIDQISEVFATDQTLSSLASVPVFQGGLKLDRAVSDYNRAHRFTFSYIWNLPGPKSGFLGQVLGGWQWSGITVFQSGAPFTIANGLDRNGDGQTGPDRPDIGNPNAPHNTRAQIATATLGSACFGAGHTGLFNPDNGQCVTRNDVYVVQAGAGSGFPGAATLGRNTERSNPVQNFDMALSKDFRLNEKFKLGYGISAFNVFNHPQFAGIPNADVTNNTPGTFLNYNLINGGGRTMQMGLKLSF